MGALKTEVDTIKDACDTISGFDNDEGDNWNAVDTYINNPAHSVPQAVRDAFASLKGTYKF